MMNWEKIVEIIDQNIRRLGTISIVLLLFLPTLSMAATLRLDLISDVVIGDEFKVTGTYDGEDGTLILITGEGPVELRPKTTIVKKGRFAVLYNTSEDMPYPVVGTYTMAADDMGGK